MTSKGSTTPLMAAVARQRPAIVSYLVKQLGVLFGIFFVPSRPTPAPRDVCRALYYY